MKKIVYITVKTPFGKVEEFIITEMLALKKMGADLVVIPRDKSCELFHKKAQHLIKDTLIIPWFNIKISRELLKCISRKPVLLFKIIRDIAFKARSIKIAFKNLIILPKAIYLSDILKKNSISHIHAHWGTTTSTMAYIISRLTNIPWSLTLHRGDIKENNLLKIKVNSAAFTRCISENGKKMLFDAIGQEYKNKIKVIHMGVEYNNSVYQFPLIRNNPFIIAVPARLFTVKGHKYLIDACVLLRKRRKDNFKCFFYGDGYLKDELKNYVESEVLTNFISIIGHIPNEELIKHYQNRKIDAVVLPSINTKDGEHEGIPVGLMEAMAYGIPVISTNTGGIPELIGDGSGIMVKEKDSEAIANAIEKLICDDNYYEEVAIKGKLKIENNFNINTVVSQLINLFSIV